MVRRVNGNHHINAGGDTTDGPTPSKRKRVFDAVRAQLDADEKRPWKLDQKLNDSPYRYTRDGLWASLISISQRLATSRPPVDFKVEEDFPSSARYSSFAEFVEKQLKGTLTSLITEVKDASR